MSLPVGHVFPDFYVGPVTHDAVAAYATAAGDDNPIHVDRDLARRCGFAAPLVQGLLIMGFIERVCRAWGVSGTPEEIESRFVRPVLEGTELQFAGRVAAIEAGRLRIRITARDRANALCLVGSIALPKVDTRLG